MLHAVLLCLLAHAFASQNDQWEDPGAYASPGSDDADGYHHSAGEYAGGNDVGGYSEGGYAAQGWDMERPVKTVVKHVVKNIAVPHHVPAPVHVPVPKYVKFFKPFAIGKFSRPVAVPHVIPVIKHIQKPMPFFTAIPVQRTVPVPKFIGLPVQVRVPKPVFIHVPKIVPVAKKYAVPITVNVPKPYIVPIFKSVPVPVPHKVPKIINIVKEVPHYVKKPVPIYVDSNGTPDYGGNGYSGGGNGYSGGGNGYSGGGNSYSGGSNSYSGSSYSNHYPGDYNSGGGGGGYEINEEDPYSGYQPVQPYEKEQEYDGQHISGSSSYSESGEYDNSPYVYDRPRFPEVQQLRANRLPHKQTHQQQPIAQHQQYNTNTSTGSTTYELNVEVNAGGPTPSSYGNAPAQSMDSHMYYHRGNTSSYNGGFVPQFVATTPSTRYSQPMYNPSPYAEYTIDQQNSQSPTYGLQGNATVSQYFTSGQPVATASVNMIPDASKSMHFYSQPNEVIYSQNSDGFGMQQQQLYSSDPSMQQSASNSHSNYVYDNAVYNMAANSGKEHQVNQIFTQQWPNGFLQQQSSTQQFMQQNAPQFVQQFKQQSGSEMKPQFAQGSNPQMFQQFAQVNSPQIIQQYAQASSPQTFQQYAQESSPQTFQQFAQDGSSQMIQHHAQQMPTFTETFDQYGNLGFQKEFTNQKIQNHGYNNNVMQMQHNNYPNTKHDNSMNRYMQSAPSTNSHDYVERSYNQGPNTVYQNTFYDNAKTVNAFPQTSLRNNHAGTSSAEAMNNYEQSGSSVSYSESSYSDQQGFGEQNANQDDNSFATYNVRPPVQKKRNNIVNPNYARRVIDPSPRSITTTKTTPPVQTVRNKYHGYTQHFPSQADLPISTQNINPAIQTDRNRQRGSTHNLSEDGESPIATANIKTPIRTVSKMHRGHNDQPIHENPIATAKLKPSVQKTRNRIVQPHHSYAETATSAEEGPITFKHIKPPVKTRHNIEPAKQAAAPSVSQSFSPISTSFSDSSYSSSFSDSPVSGSTIPQIDDSDPQPAYSHSAHQADFGYDADTKEKSKDFSVVDTGVNIGQFQHFAYPPKNDKYQPNDEDVASAPSLSSLLLATEDKALEALLTEPMAEPDIDSGDSDKDIEEAPSSIINVYTNSPFGKEDRNGHSYSFIDPAEIESSLSASNQPEAVDSAKVAEAIPEDKGETLQTSLDAYEPEAVYDSVSGQNVVYKAAASAPELVYKEAGSLNPTSRHSEFSTD